MIFVDAILAKARDGQVRNTRISVMMDVTTNGERDSPGDLGRRRCRRREVLAGRCFPSRRNRGVDDVLIAVCDGLKGLPEAITTTWERTIVQECIDLPGSATASATPVGSTATPSSGPSNPSIPPRPRSVC